MGEVDQALQTAVALMPARGRRPVTVRGWWIVGLDEGRVVAGPLGQWPAAGAEYRRLDLGPALAAALELDKSRASLRAPGAAASLAGLAWAELDGRPVALPIPDGVRPLLVGPLTAAAGTWGPRAFESAAGEQLARLVRLPGLDSLLGTFETLALNDDSARDALSRLRARHVVIVGDALGMLARAAGVAPAVDDLVRAAEAATARAVPWPRARKGQVDLADNARTAATLVSAALDARGRRRLPGELAAEACRRWVEAGNIGPEHAADRLHHLGAAWRQLFAAGVAWPGSRPGAGWAPDLAHDDPHGVLWDTYTATWAGATLRIKGPPWEVEVSSPAWQRRLVALPRYDATCREGAHLLAEMLARAAGARSPWEQRELEIDAEAAAC
ncbi:hypothetical protein [Nannocystis bainbridge]|uniref:Uncharacterized protein n=1 Tax=Nannocystis bainbridge TaxID=2995303 RepID=A0ABT5E709_9BACT|nr:hypothetical protein [Nannocystis bainbridge]MDC0720693.1 hypothetical protein [Nannocystis bainbridge]